MNGFSHIFFAKFLLKTFNVILLKNLFNKKVSHYYTIFIHLVYIEKFMYEIIYIVEKLNIKYINLLILPIVLVILHINEELHDI